MNQRSNRPPTVGGHSPWGTIDFVHPYAEGMVWVSTPGHGGLWLSNERLAAMPAEQRSADGWYEEDCEAAWPLKHFFDDIEFKNDEDRERTANYIERMLATYEDDFSRVAMPRI